MAYLYLQQKRLWLESWLLPGPAFALQPPYLIGQSSPLGQLELEKRRQERRSEAEQSHVIMGCGRRGGGDQKARCHLFAQYLQEADSRCESGGRLLDGPRPCSEAADAIQTGCRIFMVKSPEIKRIQALSNCSSKRYFNTFLLGCVIVVIVARRVVQPGQ